MENKKVNLLFYLVVLFFLAVIFILIRDLNGKRAAEYRIYASIVSNVVNQKNNQIRFLMSRLITQENEIQDLRNTLADTRNGLEALSKRLAQPAPVAVNAPVPANATK